MLNLDVHSATERDRHTVIGVITLAFATDPMARWAFPDPATYLGLAASTVSFLLAMFYFVTFFAFHKQAGSGFTTIILCVLFLGGVQLICVGILGEYVGRIYEEIKQRPLYVVKDRVGVVERERELAADLRGSPRI